MEKLYCTYKLDRLLNYLDMDNSTAFLWAPVRAVTLLLLNGWVPPLPTRTFMVPRHCPGPMSAWVRAGLEHVVRGFKDIVSSGVLSLLRASTGTPQLFRSN